MIQVPASLQFVHDLPIPSHINVADIAGNATDEEKLFSAKGFWHFIITGPFAVDVGKRIRIVSISHDDEKHQCELVDEIEVTRGVHTDDCTMAAMIEDCPDMTNFLGVLHGACSTYLADTLCGASVNQLGLRMGMDARGFTRAMEIVFSRPARAGDTLRITSTATIDGNVRSARCEIRNKKSGEICATAVQTISSQPPRLKDQEPKLWVGQVDAVGTEISIWRFFPPPGQGQVQVMNVLDVPQAANTLADFAMTDNTFL
ncbi:hypothetical protein DFH06DRAFT_1430086 [Mycena polygramma]|nr:hypothetical protein DFH06DRAFT_1430086 [Mycena polygramma]